MRESSQTSDSVVCDSHKQDSHEDQLLDAQVHGLFAGGSVNSCQLGLAFGDCAIVILQR